MHEDLKGNTVSFFGWREVPPDSSQPSANTYLSPEGEQFFVGEINEYPQMRFRMATTGKYIKKFEITLSFPQVVTLQAKLPARFPEDLPVEYYLSTEIVFTPNNINYRMARMGKIHNSATMVKPLIFPPLIYLHDFDLWLAYSPKNVQLALTKTQVGPFQEINSGQVFSFGQENLFIPRIDEEKLKIIILRGKYGSILNETSGFIVEELSAPVLPGGNDFMNVLHHAPNLTAVQQGILGMGYRNILRVATQKEIEQIRNALGPQDSASTN